MEAEGIWFESYITCPLRWVVGFVLSGDFHGCLVFLTDWGVFTVVRT